MKIMKIMKNIPSISFKGCEIGFPRIPKEMGELFLNQRGVFLIRIINERYFAFKWLTNKRV